MRFDHAIDLYIRDMRAYGRINSDRTEVAYRSRLLAHAEDVSNRDPRTIGRDDVKRTLRRWPKPNTQRTAHAVLVSFFDWAMEEGIRKDNPARQIRRARKQPTSVYRLTRHEVVAMLNAAVNLRDRSVVHIGLWAGLRNAELRGLRGANLARQGWLWIDETIAKGGRERWVPVNAALEPTIAELAELLDDDQYAICARRPADPPANTKWLEDRATGASQQAVRWTVMQVAQRAGIRAHIHPHLMRHAYGDHIARHAGVRHAQATMGHADISTTVGTYLSGLTLDELARGAAGFTYEGHPPSDRGAIADKAPTRIELVSKAPEPTTGVPPEGGRDGPHDAHGP